jgi:hypothetical protein
MVALSDGTLPGCEVMAEATPTYIFASTVLSLK